MYIFPSQLNLALHYSTLLVFCHLLSLTCHRFFNTSFFERTFEPCWKFLQSSTEKLANVHIQVIQHLNDVNKAVREYGEQQKDKQKQV